jgi:hypothetical protein
MQPQYLLCVLEFSPLETLSVFPHIAVSPGDEVPVMFIHMANGRDDEICPPGGWPENFEKRSGK